MEIPKKIKFTITRSHNSLFYWKIVVYLHNFASKVI